MAEQRMIDIVFRSDGWHRCPDCGSRGVVYDYTPTSRRLGVELGARAPTVECRSCRARDSWNEIDGIDTAWYVCPDCGADDVAVQVWDHATTGPPSFGVGASCCVCGASETFRQTNVQTHPDVD